MQTAKMKYTQIIVFYVTIGLAMFYVHCTVYIEISTSHDIPNSKHYYLFLFIDD